MSPHRRHLVALVPTLAVTLASVGIVLFALARATGERPHADGSCCHVEFIDNGVLMLTWLLFPVLAVAAWHSIPVALVGVAGMFVPQWLAMAETVDRYRRSGWSDGLEVLGFALPLGVLVLGLLTVLLAGLVARSRRRTTS